MSQRFAFSSVLLALCFCFPPRALGDAYFHTYRNALVHWTQPDVNVHVDPRLADVLGDRLPEVVRMAADSWDVSEQVPVFHVKEARSHEELTDRDGLVWVSFGEPEQFVTEVALTIATTDANTGAVQRVQVVLNPAVKWGILDEGEGSELDRYDLQAVLTHEFGHVLGLDEDEGRHEATMHPQFRRGEVRQRSLEVSDEESVTALYRKFPPSVEERQGCSVAQRAGSNSLPGLWCLPLFAGVVCRLARRRAQAR